MNTKYYTTDFNEETATFKQREVSLPSNLKKGFETAFEEAYISALHTRIYNNGVYLANKEATKAARDERLAIMSKYLAAVGNVNKDFPSLNNDDRAFIGLLVNIVLGFPKDGNSHFWNCDELFEAVSAVIMKRRNGEKETEEDLKKVKKAAEAFAEPRLKYNNAVTFKPFDIRFTKAQVNKLIEASGEGFNNSTMQQKRINSNKVGKSCLQDVLEKSFEVITSDKVSKIAH